MIPAEAIEAAAKAIYPHTRRTFDEAYDHIRERCRDQARAALEAAAPHMLAGAWDEGYRECYERQMYEPVPVNPHRPAP